MKESETIQTAQKQARVSVWGPHPDFQPQELWDSCLPHDPPPAGWPPATGTPLDPGSATGPRMPSPFRSQDLPQGWVGAGHAFAGLWNWPSGGSGICSPLPRPHLGSPSSPVTALLQRRCSPPAPFPSFPALASFSKQGSKGFSGHLEFGDS